MPACRTCMHRNFCSFLHNTLMSVHFYSFYMDTLLGSYNSNKNGHTAELVWQAIRDGQDHIYMVLLAGKLPNLQSYTVLKYIHLILVKWPGGVWRLNSISGVSVESNLCGPCLLLWDLGRSVTAFGIICARFKPTSVVDALFREVQDAVRERLLKVICHTPNCVADAFFCEVQDVQLQ
jgi:hypothetical protein